MADEVDLHNALREAGIVRDVHWASVSSPYANKLAEIALDLGLDEDRIAELESENEDLSEEVTELKEELLAVEADLREAKRTIARQDDVLTEQSTALEGSRSQVVLLLADRDRQGTEP